MKDFPSQATKLHEEESPAALFCPSRQATPVPASG